MSFEVKNIEQENIDYKMIGPLTLFVVATVIASMVFVYYYFMFEKDSMMKEQYLEADSKILKDYMLEEEAKYKLLEMEGEEGKISKTIQIYSTTKSIEQRLNELNSLEEQLLSDAFKELIARGEKNKERGVQKFYGKDKMKKIQHLIDFKGTYNDPETGNHSPDGMWGANTYYDYILWKKWKLGN